MNDDLVIICKTAKELFEGKKFTEIVGLLNDEVLKKYKSAELYEWRAKAHFRTGNFDNAISDYNQVIEIRPNDAAALEDRGSLFSQKGEFINAIADYDKAILLEPHKDYLYFARGNALCQIEEYDKAIANYNKAIELEPNDFFNHYFRGYAWNLKNDFDKAIADYNFAISLKPDIDLGYYARGDLIRKSGKNIEQALRDFHKYLELTTKKDDALAKFARDYIEELREKLKDAALKEIADLTSEIKKLLLLTDGNVTHYTGLSVLKKLLFEDNSKFRISEGSFLNDTSEGTELFNFLQYQHNNDCKDAKAPAPFVPKPFIGSFVAENKHDDLNLWRFYGKTDNVEAKGCAITIRTKEFINAINLSLSSDRQKPDPINESDIKFYRVAYWDHNADTINFHIPNSTEDVETALNNLMGDLKEKVKNYQSDDKSNLEKYINSIAFQFKSDAYKNENEIRLVVKGIEFDKKFDKDTNPPRVYIDLINIRSVTETITLGPKVDKPDEWAAAIYFSYDNETDATKKPRKILISRLPYK